MTSLIGAVVTADTVTASYAADGAIVVRSDGWGSAVMDAAAALMAAAAITASPSLVDQVQVYTAASDPDGTEFSAPGEIVDIKFAPGASRPGTRHGAEAPAPIALAQARDALKSALNAEPS